MNRRREAGRLWLIILAGTLGLTACRDNGLENKNLPLDEARHRTYGYEVYEATPADQPVAAAGHNWMPSLPVETIPNEVLVAVGNAGDTSLFAVRGTEAPYTRLYERVGDGEWRPYVRLD